MKSSRPSPLPPVALTIGDANGIGPETALAAAARTAASRPRTPPLLLVGPPAVWARAAELLSLPCPPVVPSPEAAPPPGRLAIWDPTGLPAPRPAPGRVRLDASRTAHAALDAAARAALRGRLSAIVTAPICKEGFQRAGLPGPGHTEILAAIAGTDRYAMMLFGRRIRVVLATRHLPIARVAAALSPAEIEKAVRLLAEALPWMGFPRARIGICGLNPHAGDGGAIGDEERRVIAPALARCRRARIDAAGPLPADSLFHDHYLGRYDAVVAMYHDQGLAPLKMLSFSDGVNLTLGLPFVRTSPDHGTAFPIAWKGVASPASTLSALSWALRLARKPNPWRSKTP